MLGIIIRGILLIIALYIFFGPQKSEDKPKENKKKKILQ